MKNKLVLVGTLITGMGIGAVSNNIVGAKVVPAHTVQVTAWVNDQIYIEKTLIPLVCGSVEGCSRDTLRRQEICLRYLDNDRDGKPNAWRAEASVLVPEKK